MERQFSCLNEQPVCFATFDTIDCRILHDWEDRHTPEWPATVVYMDKRTSSFSQRWTHLCDRIRLGSLWSCSLVLIVLEIVLHGAFPIISPWLLEEWRSTWGAQRLMSRHPPTLFEKKSSSSLSSSSLSSSPDSSPPEFSPSSTSLRVVLPEDVLLLTSFFFDSSRSHIVHNHLKRIP